MKTIKKLKIDEIERLIKDTAKNKQDFNMNIDGNFYYSVDGWFYRLLRGEFKPQQWTGKLWLDC